jgi:hypothetical protein
LSFAVDAGEHTFVAARTTGVVSIENGAQVDLGSQPRDVFIGFD